MKQEDRGNAKCNTSNQVSARRKQKGSKSRSGRSRKCRDRASKRKSQTKANESSRTASNSVTPKRKKNERPKVIPEKTRSSERLTRSSTSAAAVSKSTPKTKASHNNTSRKETYSYNDLFLADDEQEDLDENVDAGDEDSEYAPSDEETFNRLSKMPKTRKGVSSRTRRHSKIQLPSASEAEEGGSTEEDEAGESESEEEDEDDEELGDSILMNHSGINGGLPLQLFEDENNRMQRDIYDFDAQSIISDKRATSLKKRMSTTNAVNRSVNTTAGSRSTRRTASGKGTSWGSNIYSALAAALKTRADLDAYSSFLKSNILNASYDKFLAEVCKPSNQHANLFYGASASLQSLMSRINDHDKVVELLHAFVSRPYDELQHRIIYLLLIIHQPLFGVSHMTPITQHLETLSKNIDEELIIKPGYILNQETNLLAIRSSVASDFGVSNTQYNFITGAGNLGRYMPDINQLIVPSDLYQKLTELVALPPERIYELALARVHQQEDEADIDISPLEPPNLQRIVLAINKDGNLVGIALLDTWNSTDILHNRPKIPIDLINVTSLSNNTCSVNQNGVDTEVSNRQIREEQVREVLDNIIDWVVLKSDPKDHASSSKRMNNKQQSSIIGPIRFVDAFIVKPNGRRDTLLLVAHPVNCHPSENAVESDNFFVYSVVDESKFCLEKHGFMPELSIALDGVHTVDPEDILEDKSLLVVPDLLFDTLRKVMLRELASSSSTAAAAAAVVASSRQDSTTLSLTSTGPAAVIHCTKFVILDRQRRVPLAIAFDSPVRLTLQVQDDKLGVHPHGEAASINFDQITPSELKSYESSFKPTSAEYRLVAINGLLYGLQIDDQRVIRRIIEIVPARYDSIFPHTGNPSLCAQSISAAHKSCPSNVRIVNDETNSSTVLPAFYYPHYEQTKLCNVVSGFTDQLCSLFFELPVSISLYDVVLRMAQKYMPEILARQHIEAAEAAAYAEAAANPHAPPPSPVPLPEHWGVCCLCAKELRSPNGLLDHEMRHLGLSRFRCGVHNVSFLDRRSWQSHMNEQHACPRSGPLSVLLRPNPVNQTDSGSDQDEEEDELVEQDTVPGSGLLAGLANVFNTSLLVGRMEAPQCEKCSDYFPSAEVLAQHLDFCDGISFSLRTPLSRATSGVPKPILGDDSCARSGDDASMEASVQNVDETTSDVRDDACVCGICGTQVNSRDKILRHFTVYHLQCILCNNVLRSMEELSDHYHTHLKTDAPNALEESENEESDIIKSDPDKESVPKVGVNKKSPTKLMTCDICTEFYGTKFNYYFHQWAEHGVVHPGEGMSENMLQMLTHARHLRHRVDKDDLSSIGIRKMKCKLCGFIVRCSGKDYVQHLSEKHNINTTIEDICRICADVFESPEDLSSHLGEVHFPTGEFTNAGVQTIFRCTHCEFWGFNKGLLRHSREVHDDPFPSIYECMHCYERFTDKRVWRAHMDKHNEGYSHRCMECGRAFRLRPSLLHHMRCHHGDDQGPATCEYCGLIYPKRSSLRYHIFRMHNQELAHECFMCQRRFRLETELRRHVKEMHSGAVKCEICHKVCANLRCYAQHRQKHFRTRIYQCTDCQTTFKSKLAMKRHIRVEHLQLGPEKFECQICGKIVTQIGMHMLIHKEARFECEYCNKRFTKAAYYNEHLRIHRGEQPFECHICRKRFNKKSNLNVHLKFHEKHRDDEGNYLELKPRGRISTMFGDALMSPSDRAARQAAARSGNPVIYVPKVDVAVGSDFPGAFNCTGPAGAAAEAASRVAELYGLNGVDATNHTNSNDFILEPVSIDDMSRIEPLLKKQRLI
ncbi:Zinc finger protein 26 [Schistosoma japonicum]|nr:Zinc finger protein 26 [Schistosoma japonicum]KAH8857587.1 Zinc finger protein 26 [Schistosoma japonicum]KAH8857588.1 Zinc finger protein 26 [Schistosoma japonicum]KAH8857589.1 Zinc finger protein 26 [Schistosoma japonicum]